MTGEQMQKRFPLFLLVPILAVGAVALGFQWQRDDVPGGLQTTSVTAGGFSRALATGPMTGVIIHASRSDVETFTFKTASGADIDLSKWRGRVVLLNLWATWCGPCRKEMPDLAALQKELGGADFEVVALSVDKKGADASSAFLAEAGAEGLAVYTDTVLASMASLRAIGLPASILIDRKGKEAARILGSAAWHSPEAIALVKALMAEKS